MAISREPNDDFGTSNTEIWLFHQRRLLLFPEQAMLLLFLAKKPTCPAGDAEAARKNLLTLKCWDLT